jgi:hypothetical protein
MAFNDVPMKAGQSGKTVSGLGLSKTGAMTLELAAGNVNLHRSGGVVTLGAAQSHAFTADPTNPTQVFMALITDGVDVDLWVDAFVDDGRTVQAKPPAGYVVAMEVAWFTIQAAETNLDNATINRRTWV